MPCYPQTKTAAVGFYRFGRQTEQTRNFFGAVALCHQLQYLALAWAQTRLGGISASARS